MKKIVCLVSILMVGFACGFAQSFPSEYVSNVWDSSSGLPGNTINDMIQASSGYIYIATYDGLVRTDGISFTLLNHNTVEELDCVSARSLFEDSKGNIWIGSNDEGIAKFDGKHYTSFTTDHGLPNNSIRRITEDAQGNIWVGTASGVCYITPDSKILRPTGLAEYGVEEAICIDLYSDTAGRIWFVTPNKDGIYFSSKNTFTKYKGLENFGTFICTTISQDRNGAFWMGLQGNGAVKVDNGMVEFYNKGTPLEGTSISDITTDKEGVLWFGTESGVFVLKGNEFSKYDKSLGLVDNYIMKIIQDREGSMWLGTNSGGVEKMSLGKFRTETLDTTVNAMAEDKDGRVWIGTDSGLYCWYKNEYIQNAATRATQGLRIRHIENTKNGDVMFNCYSKLGHMRYTPSTDKFVFWTDNEGLSGDKTRVSLELSNSDIYVGTTTGLSIIEPNGNIINIHQNDGLSSDYIMCLLEDKEGNVWVGTDGGGVNILKDRKVVKLLTSKDGLAGDVIFKITQDDEGTIWITTGRGLSRYDGKEFKNLNSKSGIAADSVFQMIVDYTGTAWFTANAGILSVPFSELQDYLDGKVEKIYSKRYNKGDGLRTGGITSTSLSMTDSMGRLWFTLLNGYAIYDPVKTKSSNIAPIVNIESMAIDGSIVELGDGDRIGPGAKRVDINFTALSFTSPEMVRFRTMLEGFDTDYNTASTTRFVSYTNLKPGKYTFKVMAANSDGIWTETAAELPFTLRPYFYERTSFWVIISISVLALAGLIIYLRFRAMMAYQRELEKKVEERTIDLKAERDKSEKLLLNILPSPIAERLKKDGDSTIADKYENVTVLFSDIVSFTTISSNHTALEIVTALNSLFSKFDERAKREGVEKIKTIGDAYMAVCGLPNANKDHAAVMVKFAIGMYQDLVEYNNNSEIKFNMRIGLNSGTVIAGVIGETKFIYDIWGDTVNVASRMESTAEAGEIHVTQAVKDACGSKIVFNNQHNCQVKGKGEMVTWSVMQ